MSAASPTAAVRFETREAWLRAAAESLNGTLARNVPDFPLSLAALAVSVGNPKGGRKKIGECWPRELATDQQTHHVFIAPVLESPVLVLSTLLHEMIHAAVGCDQKHKGEFVKAARAVGFEKPWTQTPVPAGSWLEGELRAIAEELGPYPHVGLHPKPKATSERPSTMVKLYSASIDDFKFAMSRSLFLEYGAPLDPNGEEMLEDES